MGPMIHGPYQWAYTRPIGPSTFLWEYGPLKCSRSQGTASGARQQPYEKEGGIGAAASGQHYDVGQTTKGSKTQQGNPCVLDL